MASGTIKRAFDASRRLGANFTSANIDSYIENGIYQSYAESGVPFLEWGILIVVNATAGVVVSQTFIGTSGIAVRKRTNGTWSDWATVALEAIP